MKPLNTKINYEFELEADLLSAESTVDALRTELSIMEMKFHEVSDRAQWLEKALYALDLEKSTGAFKKVYSFIFKQLPAYKKYARELKVSNPNSKMYPNIL